MILNYLKLVRVPQWIKNFFVFVPLLFSQHLFDVDYFATTLFAFVVFCLTSSLIYVINDIIDIEADKAHPTKKNRPLPAGLISKQSALIVAIVLTAVIASLLPQFNKEFIYFVTAFVLLNLLYSFWFKHIVILDVFSIAAGFFFRALISIFNLLETI